MKRLIPIASAILILASSCYGLEVVRQKNVATYLAFPLIDTEGNFETGEAGSADSEIDTWSDGAAPDGFTDCTNEITEIGSTGIYYLSLTQSEMNVDYAIIRITTTGAMEQSIIIRTTVGDPLNLATTDDGSTINVTGGAVDTVTTLTGHTAQTGDSYARLGAPAGASIAADLVEIEAETDDIGAAGAGLTAIPWNASWSSENIGINWGDITNATTAHDFSGTEFWRVTAVGANAISAASIATDAIGADEIADGAIDDAAVANDVQVDVVTIETGDATDALLVPNVTHRLDELLTADSDIDGAAPPTVGSVWFEAMTKTTGSFTFDQTTDALEALADAGGGDATAANQTTIINHLTGIKGGGWVDENLVTIDANLDSVLADTSAVDTTTEMRTFLTGSDTAVSTVTTAQVNTEADNAIETYRLDELVAATNSDTAAATGSFIADLTELDGTVFRFTTNALEQAPTGGTNPNVLVDTTIATRTSQTVFTLTAGPDTVDGMDDSTVVMYDASDSDEPSATHKISSYTPATREVTLDSSPAFTTVAGDGVKIFVTPAGTTAPTAAQVADAVLQESIDDHKATANSLAEHIDEIQTDTSAVDTTTEMRTFLTGGDNPLSILTTTDNIGINLDDTSGTLDAVEISTDAITADKIAANSIGSSEIAAGAINNFNLADDAITAAKIATGAIDADAIAADAITDAKVANDVQVDVLTIEAGDATDALAAPFVTFGLDHLLSTTVTGTDVTDNSIIARMVSSAATADWDTFVHTDDSLQAISESGGGGPTAAQIVDEWETQSQADPTGFHVNVIEVGGTTQTANDVGGDVNDILDDTDDIGVAGVGLTEAGGTGDQLTSVGVNALTAAALNDFFTVDSGTTYASAVAGSVVKETADNAGGSSLTEAGIADAVWDELATGHTDAGKAGAQMWTDLDAILDHTGTSGVLLAADSVTAATVDDTYWQALAKYLHRSDGDIIYVSKSGNDSNGGTTWDDAKLTLAGVSGAVSIAGAGDMIIVGPGTFDEGSNQVILPAGVNMLGAGIGLTIVTSDVKGATGDANGCIVVPGTRSEIAYMTIQGKGTGIEYAIGAAQAAWGNDPAFTEAVVHDCLLRATYDAVMLSQTSTTMVVRNCYCLSGYDGITTLSTNNQVQVYDTTIICGTTYGTAGTKSGFALYGGRIAAHDCDVYVSGGGTYNVGAYASGQVAAASGYFSGCRFNTSGTSASDMFADGTSNTVTIFSANCGTTYSKVIAQNGATITIEERDKIVDDSTRIDGSKVNTNLDAAISTRATPSDNIGLNLDDTTGVLDNSEIADDALGQSPPTNWASLVISGGGAVDSLTQGILNTTITETNPGDVADSLSAFFDVDPTTSKTVNDVGVAGSPFTKADVRAALIEDTYDLAANASDTSLLGRILDADSDASWDWVQGEDSLQAIADSDGSDLSAVPWNANWDAEVQSEVADGLTAFGASTFDPTSASQLSNFVTVDTGESSATTGSVAQIAQGAAGDPWVTSLPGSYTTGQAGYALGQAWAAVSAGPITVLSTTVDPSILILARGDDYGDSKPRPALTWTVELATADLSGWTNVDLTIRDRYDVQLLTTTGSVENAGSAIQTVKIAIAGSQTQSIAASKQYKYDVQVKSTSGSWTYSVKVGEDQTCWLVEDQTRQ